MADAGLPDPTANLGSLDNRRAALSRKMDPPADLMLSITGLSEGARTASVTSRIRMAPVYPGRANVSSIPKAPPDTTR
jgi:hypothetical protein